ncbi:putative regulatory protein [Escherichia coli]|nr:putative regulatory protein [Escherichia coli]
MSINIGGAIIPLISAFAAHWWGWQAAMLTPGDNQHGIRDLVNATTQKPRPQEEGLPTVGHWRHDPLELRQEQQSPPMGAVANVAHHHAAKSADLATGCLLCTCLCDPDCAKRLGQYLADGKPRRQPAQRQRHGNAV